MLTLPMLRLPYTNPQDCQVILGCSLQRERIDTIVLRYKYNDMPANKIAKEEYLS